MRWVEIDGTDRVGRFVVGDAVRGLAAAAVVLYHCAFPVADGRPFAEVFPRPVGQIVTNLDLGVYVFFALSGYLIARPFVRRYIDGDAVPDVGRYGRNRVVRIVPLFWVIFTALLVRHWIADDAVWAEVKREGIGSVLAVYAFAQNYFPSTTSLLIGQAWSLDVEVVFYVAVPVAALLFVRAPQPTRSQQRAAVVVATCAVLTVVSFVGSHLLPDTIRWHRSFILLAVSFVPGVAAAAVEPWVVARLRASPGRGDRLALSAAAGALASLVAYHVAAPTLFGFDPSNPPIRVVLAALVGGLVILAPLIAQWGGRQRWGAMDSLPMRKLGAWSFGLYLWHQAVIYEVAPHTESIDNDTLRLAVLFAFVFPLSLALAACTYRFVEQPFLRLRAPARPVAAPAD